MNEKDKLLTTKQFADLCGVEKRTLFYYDEINLLKPAHLSENGYRMYQREQFDHLSMIKALQSIGLTLEEIKKLINQSDIKQSKQLLELQIPLLRQKQEELKQAELMLTHLTKELSDYLLIGSDLYFEKEQKEEYLITHEIEKKDKNNFINYLTYGYHHGVIIEDFSSLQASSVYKKVSSQEKSNKTKPEGNYACIYYSAPNGKINYYMREYTQVMKDKLLKTEGPIYMDEISSDFIRLPNEEFLFKLSVKLK